MKWNFMGFHNWTAAARGGRCWREFGTCVQVQVEDWEDDAECRKNEEGYEDFGGDCICTRNCCPILFFDFIGVKLPVLEREGESGE